MKDYFGKDLLSISRKKLFLLDMDGTIYLENNLFKGVKEFLSEIKSRGGRYVFVTNNSSKSVKDYVNKLLGLGLEVDEDNFFTSTQASVVLLKEKYNDELIYAQGTKSFISELNGSGLNITEKYNEEVSAVLLGYDAELSGEKLRNTCKMLTVLKDVPYYATNPDWVCPVEFGYVPDCGSMCFGIEKATGRSPIYIGKPNPMMINLAIKKFNVIKEQTVVIGDRIYTDITSGYNANVDTIMVLSGECTVKDYNESEVKPTFVIDGVWDLFK